MNQPTRRQYDEMKAVAQAQLESCEKVVREIRVELEKRIANVVLEGGTWKEFWQKYEEE